MLSARPTVGRDLLLVAVYNTVIGFFLTALTRYSLTLNLLYSHCMGFGIYLAVVGPSLLQGKRRIEWRYGLIGLPAGSALGFALATALSGLEMADVVDGATIASATAAIFGALGIWYLHDEARLREAQNEARAERLRRVEQEALATHTELALLQAQIEPHFLFNTLSNVVGLIDANPAAARTMLLDLTSLLRTSLARTRKPVVTLGEELDLLRAYLGIMAVRMGSRLIWNVDAETEVLSAWLPPLLVQPLVENAIRHGLEPKPEGGRLSIRCRRQDDVLNVVVTDTGCDFSSEAADGVGLTNVRKRLQAICGSDASLTLMAVPGGGATATLRLPFMDGKPAHSDR